MLYFKNDFEILKIQAEIYLKLEDYEKCIHVYNKLCQIDKHNKQRYLFRISNVYIKTNNWNAALGILLELHKEKGDNPNVSVNIGNCYYKLNEPDSACYYWKKAFSLGLINVKPVIEQNCK